MRNLKKNIRLFTLYFDIYLSNIKSDLVSHEGCTVLDLKQEHFNVGNIRIRKDLVYYL